MVYNADIESDSNFKLMETRTDEMPNGKKLRDKIKEQGYSNKDFCNKIGMSTCTFYRKIDGNGKFTVRDIKPMIAALRLSQDDVMAIFFS